jgi:hypothetical protein
MTARESTTPTRRVSEGIWNNWAALRHANPKREGTGHPKRERGNPPVHYRN